MIIPQGIGAVLHNTDVNRFAVRSDGDNGWWTYGTYLLDDEGMQRQVNLSSGFWEVISKGHIPTMEEPLKHGSAVYVDNQVFLRWTENQSERFPWIGAKDGVKLSWKDLLGMGKVEPYEL